MHASKWKKNNNQLFPSTRHHRCRHTPRRNADILYHLPLHLRRIRMLLQRTSLLRHRHHPTPSTPYAAAPKIKIPDFKRYEGTSDPRHRLRHNQSKMMPYWDYEEFVVQTFKDSLTGSALDWFKTLKVDDIPTWADLSHKFLDQYRFYAESPPTLLDLSMMEIKKDQAFKAYASEWIGKAAKHIPPITKRLQVHLFHSTLRSAYYSHLLAHTSSFSDLIEEGKKLDVGVKLGRIEAPSRKKEGETSKRQTSRSSKKILQAYAHPVHYTQAYPSASPTVIQPPPPQQYVPAQAQQNRDSTSRSPQPAQRALAPRAQQEVAFASVSFVIEVPAKESYQDSRVPWRNEGDVAIVEQEMSAMGITHSG
ncbi:hypothetical protein CRG98_022801 [Punica granatum]|uniref:Retrotransposon gag domain-containing protein n=1 Tax=Punica granatum TaxID=22663 RepID=A0A2I0JLQ4_PUNGR|nr:hypothetical protein CRG98_022801 [Punica granatum]